MTDSQEITILTVMSHGHSPPPCFPSGSMEGVKNEDAALVHRPKFAHHTGHKHHTCRACAVQVTPMNYICRWCELEVWRML